MRHMRRPDGGGGPLAENERIDDIQFYVYPRAELLIDDVVLYEAAAAGETRPFPKRVVFTGWFDTGKQGKEWPGEFAIVDRVKPRAWKAAKSVPGPDGNPWLRVGLRGERPLDRRTELTLQYQVGGVTEVRVELFNSRLGKVVAEHTLKVPGGDWAAAVIPFDLPAGAAADELRFRLPAGAELLIDDVLLSTP